MKKKLATKAGYTIVEVLVVIAVTGLMFVSAMIAFSGRQQRVQFDQAVRDFESQMQDIMNDVATGYFPNSGDGCEVSGSARPVITGASGGLGVDDDCLYIGKAIQFRPHGVVEPETKFNIYNLIGRRYEGTSTKLADSMGTVLPVAAQNSLQESFIRYGIEITKVYQNEGTEIEFGTVAIISNFRGASTPSASSQSQSLLIGGVYNSSYGATVATTIAIINQLQDDVALTNGYFRSGLQNGITVCMSDGSARRAALTIGASGNAQTILRTGEDIPGACPV